MRKLFTTLLLLISFSLAKSQIQPPLDSLIGSLKNYHDSLKTAQVLEYKNSNKTNWLYFVPGVGYDFLSNRPMISYSLTHVAAYLKTKEQQKNKTAAIEKTKRLDLETDIIKLRSLYENINMHISQFSLDTLILFKHKQLFQIYTSKFKNNEIQMENYIQYEIGILEKEKALTGSKNAIRSLILY